MAPVFLFSEIGTILVLSRSLSRLNKKAPEPIIDHEQQRPTEHRSAPESERQAMLNNAEAPDGEACPG
jgi:hypothetical protein